MGRPDKARLNKLARSIADLQAAYERRMGGVSCNVVIVAHDGRIPPHKPAKVVFAIIPVPSGCFITEPPPEIIAPVLPISVVTPRYQWEYRKRGITMTRRYVEYSLPAVYFMPMPVYGGAPEPPDRSAEIGNWKPKPVENFPVIETWGDAERENRAAELEAAGVHFLTNEEGAAIMRQSQGARPEPEAPSATPAPGTSTMAMPPAIGGPPKVTTIRLDPNAPIRFGVTR